MINQRAWPAKAMYLLIATALAISLIITAAPANKVSADPGLSEWTRVDTPTTDGWVLAPESLIMDYALASEGEVAFAVVDMPEEPESTHLLKSDDHAATWKDITSKLEAVIDVDDGDYIEPLVQVATDWEDPDFVAVALWWWDDSASAYRLSVFFSTDGGDTFKDAGEVEDGVTFPYSPGAVSDLAVSYEADGKREIAIGGTDDGGEAALFRCTVTGDSAAPWEDATAYEGWDDDFDLPYGPSEWVTDIIFSPSWTTDKTILVTTIAPDANDLTVYLQCGSWGTSPGWNEKSTLGIEAVLIKEDVELPTELAMADARGIAGMTLPEDYDSKDTDKRLLWVWVNYYAETSPSYVAGCDIVRVDDDSAGLVGPLGQVEEGEVWLTNISYHGTIAEGEAIAGVLGTGTCDVEGVPVFAECCEGVQVYRNDGIVNMDICCERWEDACKPPTGQTAMAVSYVGDDKAYAVALWGMPNYDEGAWSVTLDDGDTWNQLSLIDTYIDEFSDVAVSPDCNKTFLVSVNYDRGCYCDSVWLHAENLPEAEEYSGKWLRTWCGELEGDWGALRLAPEETTGDTVYLVDLWTANVYRNDLETLACWDPIASTIVDYIGDLALQDADTAYAMDYYGDVAMFDDDEWQEPVDSKIDEAWTIAVWGDHILVGGVNGEVSYSDDGGETFEALQDVATDGYVTVAFDSYFDQNNTIYAGVAWANTDSDNGIYRWVIGESEAWTDLRVEPLESQVGVDDGDAQDENIEVDITGVVLDNADGNPMTSADTGGVLYVSYYGDWDGEYFTGVARYLTPAEDVICKECGDWDYLFQGLTIDLEGFETFPDALEICGCLTPDSNSKLFSIDSMSYYDMEAGKDGAVWTFEDCYAKKAPDITSPADTAVIAADPCSCFNVPFGVLWDRLCDACIYDIQFALDEDFVQVVHQETGFLPPAGDAPAYHVPGGLLTCESTYYYRVRAREAETGQVIRSWWSDPLSLTIAPAEGAGVMLTSPDNGVTNVPITDIGFTWSTVRAADDYDWVLSLDSDFATTVETATGLANAAYTYTGTLDYDTPYYWQVIAYKDASEISRSTINTFTTRPEAEEPPPPAEEPVTPAWVWVVIAIGAVLVIVVIVLIFRTRRV